MACAQTGILKSCFLIFFFENFDNFNVVFYLIGSGKTAAFLIPTLSKLFGKAKKLAAPRPLPGARRFKAEPLVLIIAPTRELATQIFDECRRFTYRSMMRPWLFRFYFCFFKHTSYKF